MAGSQDNGLSSRSGDVSLLVLARYILGKWYWLLLAGLIAGLAAFVSVKLVVTPAYRSTVSFYVYNSPDSNASTRTVNNQDLQAAESLATTYSNILESNTVYDAVLKDLGSDGRGLDRTDLSKMAKVSVIDNTQLLEVEVVTPDPSFSCRVATAFQRVAHTELQRITKDRSEEVVDQAEVPDKSISPRIGFATGVGFVVGAVLCAVVLSVRMLADKTIYIPEDITLSLPVLGTIPNIKADTGRPGWTFAASEEVEHASEA